jgi:GntR family transcriptional regulator of arabinose operon
MMTAKQEAATSAASRVRVSNPARNVSRRLPLAQVVLLLEDLCDSLQPGDRIPTHLALMDQFQASERVVLQALEEMQRRGRILRKRPLGTFVTEPPPSATPLVSERTIIAVALTDHAFFDCCLDNLCRLAETMNLSLICKPVSGDAADSAAGPGRESLEDRPQSLIGSAAGGFILLGWRLSPLAEKLQREGVRVVLIGSPPTDAETSLPYIHGNQEQGGFLITSHLIDLGHRNLAVVHRSHEDLYRTRRWRGHERALEAARQQGIIVNSQVLVREDIARWESDPGQAAARLRMPDAPAGLICWNDFEAAKILGILARAGVRVPEEVSVTGYDALPEGDRVFPRLTTVDQAIDEQIRFAFEFVTRPVPSFPTMSAVPAPRVIVRESTSAPRPH